MSPAALVASLCAEIDLTLRPLLAGGGVALLDFPRYANVGDSAIWLGQLRYLQSLGVGPPVVTHAVGVGALERLADRVGRRPILLSGGGNLGDLWPRHQQFRERVIAAFPNNRIVQLPQTIHFREKASLERARAVFDGHPDLTLLVRDRHSLDVAAQTFRADVRLCPDMAFYLGPLRRARRANHPVVMLLRGDSESAVAETPPDSVDWATEPPSLTAWCERALARQLGDRPRLEWMFRRPWEALANALAQRRLGRGVDLLCQGRTVVTDRLHGHIICLLLGIRHFVVDDRHGKLRNFYDTWTRGAPLGTWCADLDDARRRAAAGGGGTDDE